MDVGALWGALIGLATAIVTGAIVMGVRFGRVEQSVNDLARVQGEMRQDIRDIREADTRRVTPSWPYYRPGP